MTQSILGSSVSSVLPRFWRWWVDELRSLFSAGKSASSGLGAKYLLEVDSRQLVLRDAASREILSQAIDAGTAISATGHSIRGATIDVLLTPERALFQTITLPASTQENIRQVLEYELDRVTPFKKEDIYFEIAAKEMQRDSNTVKLELCVIKKKLIDGLLTELGGQNIAVHDVGVVKPDGAPLLFDRVHLGLESATSPGHTGLTRLLLVIVAVLIVTSIALPFVKLYWQNAALQREISGLSEQVKEVRDVQDSYARSIQEDAWIFNRLNKQPPMIELIDELTRVIKDQSYLESFSYQNGEIYIKGKSKSASGLLADLDSSNLLDQVQFAAPVTQSAGDRLERFEIEMVVAGVKNDG